MPDYTPLGEPELWERYDGLPPELIPVIMGMDEQTDALLYELFNGEITVEAWEQLMGELIGLGATTGYMVGAGSEVIPPKASDYLTQAIAQQLAFLSGFALVIAANQLGNKFDDTNFDSRWFGRARQYNRTAVEQYWRANTSAKLGVDDMPLPAYPGDGTSQCLKNCKCRWRIEVIGDIEDGNADAYWELGVAEHCQTCVERHRAWNPLQIRNWELILPYRTKQVHLPLHRIAGREVSPISLKGGKGSGFTREAGHAGIPGKRGGSRFGGRVAPASEVIDMHNPRRTDPAYTGLHGWERDLEPMKTDPSKDPYATPYHAQGDFTNYDPDIAAKLDALEQELIAKGIGYVDLYHGTPAGLADSLKQYGILPGRVHYGRPPSTYFVDDIETMTDLASYVQHNVPTDLFPPEEFAAKTQPVWVRIRVPIEKLSDIFTDAQADVDFETQGCYRMEQAIPPSWIDGMFTLRLNHDAQWVLDEFKESPSPDGYKYFYKLYYLMPEVTTKGGAGSGHHGHVGVPGKRGGSAPKGAAPVPRAPAGESITYGIDSPPTIDWNTVKLPSGYRPFDSVNEAIKAELEGDDVDDFTTAAATYIEGIGVIGVRGEGHFSHEQLVGGIVYENPGLFPDIVKEMEADPGRVGEKAVFVFDALRPIIGVARSAKKILESNDDPAIAWLQEYVDLDKEMHKLTREVDEGVFDDDHEIEKELERIVNKYNAIYLKHQLENQPMTTMPVKLSETVGMFRHAMQETYGMLVMDENSAIPFVNFRLLVGNFRGKSLYITTQNVNSKILRQLQRMYDAGVWDMELADNDTVRWQTYSEHLGHGYSSVSLEYDLSEFLSAKHVFIDSDGNISLKETTTKGGTGSGNVGHAGRPGKRGGSLPKGVRGVPVDKPKKQPRGVLRVGDKTFPAPQYPSHVQALIDANKDAAAVYLKSIEPQLDEYKKLRETFVTEAQADFKAITHEFLQSLPSADSSNVLHDTFRHLSPDDYGLAHVDVRNPSIRIGQQRFDNTYDSRMEVRPLSPDEPFLLIQPWVPSADDPNTHESGHKYQQVFSYNDLKEKYPEALTAGGLDKWFNDYNAFANGYIEKREAANKVQTELANQFIKSLKASNPRPWEVALDMNTGGVDITGKPLSISPDAIDYIRSVVDDAAGVVNVNILHEGNRSLYGDKLYIDTSLMTGSYANPADNRELDIPTITLDRKLVTYDQRESAYAAEPPEFPGAGIGGIYPFIPRDYDVDVDTLQEYLRLEIWHEFGHHVEHTLTVPYRHAIDNFYLFRVDVADGKNPFMFDYMQTRYRTGATELLSCAFEIFSTAPWRLAQQDPEMFGFILSIIQGTTVLKGGQGSGNFGHRGRPGQVGGSGEGGSEAGYNDAVNKLREVADGTDMPRRELWSRSITGRQLLNTPDNPVKIFFEREMGGDVTMRYGNGDERWNDIYGNPVESLYFTDNDNTQLSVGIQDDGSYLYLGTIFKKPDNLNNLGSRFMGALKKYCDLTGKPLRVVIVANKPYFRHFDWLTELDSFTFGYDPNVTTKGGTGSGNIGHAGRPGKRGGSLPKGERSTPAINLDNPFLKFPPEKDVSGHPVVYEHDVKSLMRAGASAVLEYMNRVKPQVEQYEKLRDDYLVWVRNQMVWMENDRSTLSSPDTREAMFNEQTSTAVAGIESHLYGTSRIRPIGIDDRVFTITERRISPSPFNNTLEREMSLRDIQKEYPQAAEHFETYLNRHNEFVQEVIKRKGEVNDMQRQMVMDCYTSVLSAGDKAEKFRTSIALAPRPIGWNIGDIRYAPDAEEFIRQELWRANQMIDKSVYDPKAVDNEVLFVTYPNRGAYTADLQQISGEATLYTWDSGEFLANDPNNYPYVQRHTELDVDAMQEAARAELWHELGHHVEARLPAKTRQALRDYRTNKNTSHMFFDYMNREYSSGETEILSCAFEIFATAPWKLARQDPYLFSFILGIIHGNVVLKGGEGSGNFGHRGRPGKVGGSGRGGLVTMGITDIDVASRLRAEDEIPGYAMIRTNKTEGMADVRPFLVTEDGLAFAGKKDEIHDDILMRETGRYGGNDKLNQDNISFRGLFGYVKGKPIVSLHRYGDDDIDRLLKKLDKHFPDILSALFERQLNPSDIAIYISDDGGWRTHPLQEWDYVGVNKEAKLKGGAGSGHRGHVGVLGRRGGSAPKGAARPVVSYGIEDAEVEQARAQRQALVQEAKAIIANNGIIPNPDVMIDLADKFYFSSRSVRRGYGDPDVSAEILETPQMTISRPYLLLKNKLEATDNNGTVGLGADDFDIALSTLGLTYDHWRALRDSDDPATVDLGMEVFTNCNYVTTAQVTKVLEHHQAEFDNRIRRVREQLGLPENAEDLSTRMTDKSLLIQDGSDASAERGRYGRKLARELLAGAPDMTEFSRSETDYILQGYEEQLKAKYGEDSKEYKGYYDIIEYGGVAGELREKFEFDVNHAVTAARLTPSDVEALTAFYVSNQGKWMELPDELYHVTTDAAAVIGDQLRSRYEMHGHDSEVGLAGGDDKTISLTNDLKTAKEVEQSLQEAWLVANGMLTATQMFEGAQNGSEGIREDWSDRFREFDSEKSLDRLMAYERGEEVKKWDGTLMTEEAYREALWYLWSHAYLYAREGAGGMSNPVFFGTNWKALAKLDPKQFKTLVLKPKMGKLGKAKGYQMSSMGEFRIFGGENVEIIAANDIFDFDYNLNSSDLEVAIRRLLGL